MKSILVHADGSPAMPARLETALAIARTQEAHLCLQLNTPLQRYLTMDPFGASYIAKNALEDALQAEAAMGEALAAQLASQDVPFTISHSDRELVDSLASASRLADLLVLSVDAGDAKSGSSPAVRVGDLAIATRCPVLALPSGAGPTNLDGPAMVAWNGSPEAANALRAAVPLLASAGEVHLVTIAENVTDFPGTEAMRYLSRHNVHAMLHDLARDKTSVAEQLEATAASLGAQWVVMGAYGHSRLREVMFGGVTRYLLDQARLPLLLAH